MLLFLSLSVAAFSQIEEVSITNLKDLNTEKEDFMAVPYGDGIMYNTNVKDNKCDTCRFQNLRFAKANADTDCSFAPATIVPNNLAAKHNYGAPTFGSNGKWMIISQNNTKPRKSDRRLTMKLATAQLSDQNSWVKGEDLPFNSIEFETTHPSLSADGQKLYFASDRPGSIGGMDIWVVMKQGDSWGTPTNLGAPINTAGNELFPSVNESGTLHFSSNRAGGMGGLDVYSATMTDGAWTTASLGAPFNSNADDLGYVELADGESGYLTSNRGGGKGKDDLYCWKINTVPAQLAVEDANSKDRLPGSKITITGPNENMDFIADGNGGAEPDITFRRMYTINVEKEGYEPWSKTVDASELATADTYIVPLVPRAYTMNGDVKLLGSETIVPGSKIVLHNLTTGEKREAIADKDGKFTFDNIRCFEDYELIAYDGKGDDARESEKFPLPASAIDCASDEPTMVTLRLPVPKPVYVEPVCPTFSDGLLSLPSAEVAPKPIRALGSRPEFGNSHDLDANGFYNKLKNRYNSSKRDAAFLDELFTALGYANGFADAGAYTFYETTIPNGMTGKMGYTSRHKMKYVQLNARNERDLQAFKVSSVNGCDVYFMKTCGNLFYFREN